MTDQPDKDDKSFLSRWSERKTADRERDADPTEKLPDADESKGELANVEGKGEEIAAEDLPDIETLDQDSDFTPFLKDGVPEELRRLALRKLWMSDPAFSVLDGLNDYDDDYSMIGTVVQEITSRYRPGKGMLDDEDIKKNEEQHAKIREADQRPLEESEAEDPDQPKETEETTGADQDTDDQDPEDQAAAAEAEGSAERDETPEALDAPAALDTPAESPRPLRRKTPIQS